MARLAFGGYASARWSEDLREHHHLTYAAVASRRSLGKSGGIIMIEFDTAAETVERALTITMEHLTRYAIDGPTMTEVARAFRYAIGSQTITLAGQAGCAAAVGEALHAGLRWDHPWRHLTALSEVTAPACRHAAADLAWPALSCVVVGPPGLDQSMALGALLDTADGKAAP